MPDLGSVLKDAAGTPRQLDMAAVSERAERARRRGRVARAVGGAGALAVVLGVTVVALAVLSDDRSAVARATDLPIPPVDEPLGTFLDDGTPVWVTQDEEGTVHVLAASYPDDEVQAWGVRWCPTSGMFESYWFSAWGLDGRRRATGPAPTGLSRYEVEVVDSATVRVPVQEPAPGDRELGDPPPRNAQWCDGGPASVDHPAWDDKMGG